MMAALPGMIAVVGVVALAYNQAKDHKTQQDQINDSLNRLGRSENNQNQICNTVSVIYFLCFHFEGSSYNDKH